MDGEDIIIIISLMVLAREAGIFNQLMTKEETDDFFRLAERRLPNLDNETFNTMLTTIFNRHKERLIKHLNDEAYDR